MATQGTRGKWAEAKVRAWMQQRSDVEARFWFYRYPDARAGALQTVPADFGAMHRGVPYLVEVKEVDHDYRLPSKNFSADKVARMHKFTVAGGLGCVVIYHRTTKVWRLVPVDQFLERKPSWDLTKWLPRATLHEVMTDIFGEK